MTIYDKKKERNNKEKGVRPEKDIFNNKKTTTTVKGGVTGRMKLNQFRHTNCLIVGSMPKMCSGITVHINFSPRLVAHESLTHLSRNPRVSTSDQTGLVIS